jgi:glycosyltransferase involved in cell wall biosynthesis
MSERTPEHLAYLCSSVSWGGLEMNQMRNALWMKERGHNVLVICKKDSPIEKASNTEGLSVAHIGSHRKYYDFKAGKVLATILDQHKITHLIIRDTRDMSLSVIAKRKAKQTIHLSYFMEMQMGVPKKHILHTIRYRYLDAWCCPLNWLADQVRTLTRFDHTKIHVIPSALDLSRFSNPMSQEEARSILELPTDKIIIGLSGRFDPFKGHLLLLEAVNKLDNRDVAICFLGEPTKGSGSEYTDQIAQTIDQYGMKDRVFIRPFRKDIEVFYASIDLFIMASKAETFGMVTIEAMASGVPVIASNGGGSPEILGHGKYGRLFEPLNAKSLSDKINEFLSEDKLDQSVLLNAASAYDHHTVCTKVEEVLRLV